MFFLHAKGVTQFVAACNSVSVSVIQPLVDLFGVNPTRVIEMVGLAGKALRAQSSGKVLVVATEATVRSGMYERVLTQQGLSVEMLAIPELALTIEQGAGENEIRRLVQPAIARAIQTNAEVFVFGCTHYPLARAVFEQEFASRGVKVNLFDPSEAVADEVVQSFDISGTGSSTFFVTKPSVVFDQLVNTLFGSAVSIKTIDVDNIVDNSVYKECVTTPFQACGSLSE